MTEGYEFRHLGYCDICESEVEFSATRPWFRDFLLCPSCGSIPRERALMQVLKRYYPDYRKRQIHESSPLERGVSQRLRKKCRQYSASQYFPDQPLGSFNEQYNARNETLEAMTLADASVDLVITQDVMEHVFDPAAAFREIARILKPGGAHIFTVPLVRKSEPSRPRATRNPDGSVNYLLEAQYHGNPVDSNGALVTMDWGCDIVGAIQEVSGMPSQIIFIDDIDRGIRAEFIDVIVSFKR
jgi:SAM-dependent methyltransferase